MAVDCAISQAGPQMSFGSRQTSRGMVKKRTVFAAKLQVATRLALAQMCVLRCRLRVALAMGIRKTCLGPGDAVDDADHNCFRPMDSLLCLLLDVRAARRKQRANV